MSINHNPVVIAVRETCAICGDNQLELVINLPNLPLTDTYSQEFVPGYSLVGIDQQLLFCHQCGHVQLGTLLDPADVYSDGYNFRTSVSATARRGTDFFLSVLDEIAPNQHFECVIDLGCNDLYLLQKLKGRAAQRIGIDPLWAGKEGQQDDQDIKIIGATIENADLDSILTVAPDLVVCRHTLEHIYDPRSVLQKLFDVATEKTLFLFEVPGFDVLVGKMRFDQVFHQHLQYFSVASFRHLIAALGGEYKGHWENYHDWGALLMAFTKSGVNSSPAQSINGGITLPIIKNRYEIFQQQMVATSQMLNFLDTKIYGYGAAQMLPVLAYHLQNDLSSFAAVLDDDPAKDGLRYWNLPVKIQHAAAVDDLQTAAVFITAVDNVKPILSKLLLQRPKQIIYPFHII